MACRLSWQFVANSPIYPLEYLLLLKGFSFHRKDKMPVSNDKDLQAGTSKDSQELSARKQKLEDDIRHLEAVNKSL